MCGAVVVRCGGCAGQHMVWCGVVVLVSSSRCEVVATRCEVDAVMTYTGDWIVVAADNTVCRQSSWWRNGCLRRMALAFSLCSARLRDCWICKAHVFSSSPVRADFNLACSLNTLLGHMVHILKQQVLRKVGP